MPPMDKAALRVRWTLLFLLLSGISPQLTQAFQSGRTSPPRPSPLTIPTGTLPGAAVGATYTARLRASGGVAPFHWELTRGELPLGLDLDEDGNISGTITRAGEYHFVATVTDSDQPPNHTSKEFVIGVVTPLVLEWSTRPSVQGNEISGSVKVSNGTTDDFDLTVIVVGVNEIGKAFALGYEHFDLASGTTNFEIPFASTVPQGGYVVHVDAVAEVESRNAIYRRRLQTPAPLRVNQPL